MILSSYEILHVNHLQDLFQHALQIDNMKYVLCIRLTEVSAPPRFVLDPG